MSEIKYEYGKLQTIKNLRDEIRQEMEDYKLASCCDAFFSLNDDVADFKRHLKEILSCKIKKSRQIT